MKHLKYTIIITLTAIWVMGCSLSNSDNSANDGHDSHGEEQDQGHGHGHGNEGEAEGIKEEVHLNERQIQVMGIEMGKFQYLNLSTTVKSNGQLEVPPQNKASVSAMMGGRVKSINVLEGDHVNKGQTLALLEHPDFVDMERAYITAKSSLGFLKMEFERKQSLYTDSISSAKAYQKVKADYEIALATTNALKVKLKMLNINVSEIEKGNFVSAIPIKAPINGYVHKIEINIGKFLQPEQEMFELVDNEHIHIDLMVYEKDMHKIKVDQKVAFTLTNNPDSVFQGTIFSVGKSFEDEPKAMVVHAEIDNKMGNLLPGMYVDARIITDDKEVRALPDDAIVSDGGLNYIFVLKNSAGKGNNHGHQHENEGEKEQEHGHGDGHDHGEEMVFRKMEVSTGAKDIGFTEVVTADNIPDQFKIVTKGAFYLLAEMKKGEGGGGHGHAH